MSTPTPQPADVPTPEPKVWPSEFVDQPAPLPQVDTKGPLSPFQQVCLVVFGVVLLFLFGLPYVVMFSGMSILRELRPIVEGLGLFIYVPPGLMLLTALAWFLTRRPQAAAREANQSK